MPYATTRYNFADEPSNRPLSGEVPVGGAHGGELHGGPDRSGSSAEDIAAADRVVVHKAEHKLYLYSGSQLLGEYKVQLGLSPSGQKEREHDFRTPEGRYYPDAAQYPQRLLSGHSSVLPQQGRRAAGAQESMGAGGLDHDSRLPQCAASIRRRITSRTTGPTDASRCPIPTWSKCGCARKTIFRSISTPEQVPRGNHDSIV